MKTTKLVISDYVNVKFEGLEPLVRRKLNEELKFFIPYARHTPLFKMGRWDGKAAFATIGGGTYINMLDRALPIVMDAGYEIEIDDRRPEFNFSFPEVNEAMFSHKVWPEGHPIAGQPIELRDYQCDVIRNYLANLQSIQEVSTGAGKTLLTAALSCLIEPYGRSIVIVPSKSLVEQTEEDYRNLGLDVGIFYGDRKEFGHQHTICTWQSLSVFAKKSRREDLPIDLAEFIEGVVCVMVDETHSAKATELKDLLCGPMANIPIRWGLTGTVPKEEFEYLAIYCSLGPVVGEVKAKTLQDKGVLANCHVNILQLIDDHVEFKDYHEEAAFLTSDEDRMAWMAEFVAELGSRGNTLVLVDKIKSGEFLRDNIPDSVFVSGNMKTKDRRKEYKEVATAEGKIIIATYGVAAVGINVPRIFNLVLLEAGKSFTRVIQSIGRGIRKAHDKDDVMIFDACSTLKFSKKHLAERKKYYRDAEYPSSVTKINYSDDEVIDVVGKLMK